MRRFVIRYLGERLLGHPLWVPALAHAFQPNCTKGDHKGHPYNLQNLKIGC